MNVLYSGDRGALTGDFSSAQTLEEMSTMIIVPANAATHTFVVNVIDDQIAAEFIRTANIMLQPGGGYTVSDTASTVTIAVEDDDVATVSISPVIDRVIEGSTIVFTVTWDLAIDQASSITLTLTHNGDFFSPAMDTLDLDNPINPANINLKLTDRNQRNGKVYYYLDHNFTIPRSNSSDILSHNSLDGLFNDRADTIDTQSNGHIGNDDKRSVIIDGYALVLPTATEIQAFFANNGVPDGWTDTGSYWSASSPEPNQHNIIILSDGTLVPGIPSASDTSGFYVFLQVLTAQRTIVVDFPASQTPIGTVMVEVATIDTDDSTTDGSLIAELIAVTSPIELGSTVSKVAIQHNNSEVTITGPDGAVDENSSATLVIHVGPSVPNHRSLDVNLSYMDVISGTTEMTTITVPAGSTSQSFQIFVGDDNIAAQPIRPFDVSLEPGDYVVGTPSAVAVSVLNEDSAVVSVLAVSDIVKEGTSALFTVQVSNEIATSLTVIINLTTIGNFGISQGSTNVVINAGNTTALLTVMTDDDETEEAYGSLIATIDSLRPQMPISGVQPTTSDVSATVTILDDDLDLSVSITTLDDKAITTISESDDEVMLRLMLSTAINRLLRVDLSYVDDFGLLAAGAPTVVEVLAGMTTHQFTVPIINDRIAAQSTRAFNVTVESGLGYGVGDLPAVEISVLNDDPTVVSIISLTTDPIKEGESALFEVQVSNEIATSLTAGIELTTVGNFGISQGSTNVVINAGTTTALLTVGTIDDEIGEVYGSLTATIDSLRPRMPVSGVQPAINITQSSATVTILDDDLDLSVSITTLDNTISESDGMVMLRLILSDAINRPLQVNLSYVDDFRLLATGAPSFVVVPVNTTTHQFTVPIINDRIAAQPERNN